MADRELISVVCLLKHRFFLSYETCCNAKFEEDVAASSFDWSVAIVMY
jgi:hypothetical protein